MDDFEGTRHGFYSGGEGAKKKGGANNAPAFPFSSFSQEGPSSGLGVGIGLGQGTAGYGVSQSLLGLTTFIPTSDCSGLSAPNSTQNKGFSGMKLSPEEQQRQLILRSETMEPTGSSSSHGGGGGGSVLNEVMEVEDGDSNSNIAGSQHSGDTSSCYRINIEVLLICACCAIFTNQSTHLQIIKNNYSTIFLLNSI